MAGTRIKFRGMPATAGVCRCGKRIIVGDVKPGGGFETFHERPECASYKALLVSGEATEQEISVDPAEFKQVMN